MELITADDARYIMGIMNLVPITGLKEQQRSISIAARLQILINEEEENENGSDVSSTP